MEERGTSPEIAIHSDWESPGESVEIVMAGVVEPGYLPQEPTTTGAVYTPEEGALVEEPLKSLGYL